MEHIRSKASRLETAFATVLMATLFLALSPAASAHVTADATWSGSCGLACTGSASGDHHAHVGPGEGDLFVAGGWANGCAIPLEGGSCDTHAGGIGYEPGECVKATATTDAAMGHDSDVAGSEGCQNIEP